MKDLLKKYRLEVIFSILETILAIGILILSIMKFIAGASKTVLLMSLFLIPLSILVMMIIYGLIKFYILDKKLLKKSISIFILSIIAISLLIIFIPLSFYKLYDYLVNTNIEELIKKGRDDDSFKYFVYNEKFYYLKKSPSIVKRLGGLYSTDLDGKKSKQVCSMDYEFENIEIYYIYKNDLYFAVNDSIRKINIKTCEDSLIFKTKYNYMNNNIRDDFTYFQSEDEFVIYDNKKGTNNKVYLGHSILINSVLDYDNNIIYSSHYSNDLDESDPSNPLVGIYKNDEKIINKSGIILGYSNNYVLFFNKGTVYRYSYKTKKITVDKKLETFSYVKAMTRDMYSDLYFEIDGIIHKYNQETDQVEVLFDLPIAGSLETVNTYNNLVVFRSTARDDVIIYNKETKEMNDYYYIDKIFFDNNKLYIYNKNGNLEILDTR